ncbi:glycoside hydrolase family 13 protein [Mobilibacterium timonense]|uniref:glycoside hydrolase family 13 protein n=2 Tax=Mobilibacterium timonense TaxID=1871012 RepID=UPI000986A244|nr:glycoside hydrolase family 13 protein [Mobilibacterium timonense]
MKKESVIFNSRDGRFKKPTGAIRSGDVLELRIYVHSDLDPLGVRVFFLYDRHTQPALYEMDPAGTGAADGSYIQYETSFPVYDTGLYWYYFQIETGKGIINVGRDGGTGCMITGSPMSWQQTVYKREYQIPGWLQGGIIYHIFVDRFSRSAGYDELKERLKLAPTANSPERHLHHIWGQQPDYKPVNGRIMNNDFYGGDLQGIISRLDYLKELGVTCIYLSPIFRAYSNHKYDTMDYMEIDPSFGTEDDFRELCEKAGGMGMRVILDGVFAHTGSDSVYFDREHRFGGGAYGDPESSYRDWYFFHPDGTYDTWWGIDTLPKLNKEDPGYRRFICGEDGVARKWLRAGASGWRLDVADELPVDFLEELTEAVKDEKPDALVLGEVWEDASSKVAYGQRKNYFEGNKLDSVMNYPLRQGIIDFVRGGHPGLLVGTVEQLQENYPPEVTSCLMNILGTHDTQRIITALAGQIPPGNASMDWMASAALSARERSEGRRLLKIASALQMTLPGVPCIYYGDETGMEGYRDPFNRGCFPWNDVDEDLVGWYRRLSMIRREHYVYRSGGYRTVQAIEGLYAFQRFLTEGDRERLEKGNMPADGGSFSYASVITAANCGGSAEELHLTGSWCDLLTGRVLCGNTSVLPGELMILEEAPGDILGQE